MNYFDQWQFLAARIEGLIRAGELHVRLRSVNSNDSYGRSAGLLRQMDSAISALKAYHTTHKSDLPTNASFIIDDFLRRAEPLVTGAATNPDDREDRVGAALVMFSTLLTEVSFLLTDVQQVIRSRAERAFEHLQRLIVADAESRAKWRSAFDRGETYLEGLGAVHLLLHGIWAFKAGAAGERTDLLYQDELTDATLIRRTADGLVLTEWKVAAAKISPHDAYAAALTQAQLYSKGSLAGIELRAYRYLIVVSPKRIVPPDDLKAGDIIYRHVNIAVDPDTPSKESAKSKRRTSSSGVAA